MQTWDVPLRIVRTRFKVLYFVAFVAEGLLLRIEIPPATPQTLQAVFGNVIFIAFFFVAVRSFRGRREPVQPPRALWRMTGTVRSAIVLAVFLLLATAGSVVAVATPSHPLTLGYAIWAVINILENLALAVLYVNSAVRLRRSPDPIVPKPVILADPVTGLD